MYCLLLSTFWVIYIFNCHEPPWLKRGYVCILFFVGLSVLCWYPVVLLLPSRGISKQAPTAPKDVAVSIIHGRRFKKQNPGLKKNGAGRDYSPTFSLLANYDTDLYIFF